MDFLQDHTSNQRLSLIRYIAEEAKGAANTVVYIFPRVMQSQYSIKLEVIRAVLGDLEERGCIEIIMKPNYRLTDEQRAKRDDEEDYYYLEVFDTFYEYKKALETTADFFGSSTESNEQNPVIPSMSAELSFESITTPIVTVDGDNYEFPSMRSGTAFNIISYCLTYSPDRSIRLKELREDLKAKQMDSSGITNLRENIRKSLFGDGKPLSVFVRVSSQGIIVKPRVVLTNSQLAGIASAAKTSPDHSE